MKLYLNQTVHDAALDRIRRLYDEFEQIVVNFSGGKDSTVTLNLTLQVAEERGRLPVNVLFLDQEAEWQTVIDYVRRVMHDPRVKPYWLQIPIRIFNATTTHTEQEWLNCWEPGAEWIRPKEPDSIHENIIGTDRFAEAFGAFQQVYFPHRMTATLAGVRCEESPARMNGLTQYATYKDITWGTKVLRDGKHFSFYPLYDWSYTDIWKAIHDHGWPYCRLYDYMYQYGIEPRKMRVSNVHHETAVDSLRFLQEIEPQTWDRIAQRVGGVNTVNQMRESYRVPKDLPPMFKSWPEYRDYLVDHLILDPEKRARFHEQFRRHDALFVDEALPELWKTEISAVLVNDYHMTKLTTFHASHAKQFKNAGRRGGKREALHA